MNEGRRFTVSRGSPNWWLLVYRYLRGSESLLRWKGCKAITSRSFDPQTVAFTWIQGPNKDSNRAWWFQVNSCNWKNQKIFIRFKRPKRQATHSFRAPIWRTCWTSWSAGKLVLIAVSTFCNKTRRDSLWPPSTVIATSSWCTFSRLSTSASGISLSSLTTIVFSKISILKLKHETLDQNPKNGSCDAYSEANCDLKSPSDIFVILMRSSLTQP